MSKLGQLRSMSIQLAYLRKSKCSSLKREMKQENRFGNATSYRKRDTMLTRPWYKLMKNHETTCMNLLISPRNYDGPIRYCWSKLKTHFNSKQKYRKKNIPRKPSTGNFWNNLDRIVFNDDVGDTAIRCHMMKQDKSKIKHHQCLLPKNFLKELLHALLGKEQISWHIQSVAGIWIAKHVKRWVEGCEICSNDKRVRNNAITPDLLNLPQWDLGPEDAMLIDLLPNIPINGGYQPVMTTTDVFLWYLFAYPLIEVTATNVAEAIMDIMTKDSYLPTTLITDNGPVYTSTVAKIAQILGITLKCVTTTHPQIIGKRKWTNASLKTSLKMVSGEYRRQWHENLSQASYLSQAKNLYLTRP